MDQRVSSDDPSITTFRGRIERAGATDRLRVALPPEARDDVPPEIVRLVLDGRTRHADVRTGTDGPVIFGVYDSPRLARSPGDGENRLPTWLSDVGLGPGRSVLIDVVVPDFLYGVRPPGKTAVYDAVEPPSPELSQIADRLDG